MTFNIPYVRDEIKDSARDTPIERSNILTYSRLTSWKKWKRHIDWKKKKLKIYVPDRTVILESIRHWAYALQDSHKLSSVSLNVTQSDSLW